MLRAVSVALDHGFNGRKARSDYFDKPIMSNMIQQAKISVSEKASNSVRKTPDNPEGWTDEQIKQKRKELAMALDVMLYNNRGAEIAKKKQNEVNDNGIVNQSADNLGSDSGSSYQNGIGVTV